MARAEHTTIQSLLRHLAAPHGLQSLEYERPGSAPVRLDSAASIADAARSAAYFASIRAMLGRLPTTEDEMLRGGQAAMSAEPALFARRYPSKGDQPQ